MIVNKKDFHEPVARSALKRLESYIRFDEIQKEK